MDFSKMITILVACLFVDVSMLFSAGKIINLNPVFSFRGILTVILLYIFSICNYILIDNALRIIPYFMAIILSIKYIYNTSFFKSTFVAFITYMLLFCSEILFDGIILLIVKDILLDKLVGWQFLGANFSISIVNVILILMFNKYFRKLVRKIEFKSQKVIYFFWFLIILVLSLLLLKVTIDDWVSDEHFISNFILIAGFITVSFIVIQQIYDKQKLASEYDKFVNYAVNTETLVEQYRVAQHENINELLIIKGMTDHNNSKLNEYLDGIINDKTNIKAKWIHNLKYLPTGGLKGVMHYKISEMLDQSLNVMLTIDRSIENSFICNIGNKNNGYMCKFICIFLDNAREAAICTDKKRIFVDMTCDKTGNVIITIANDFNNDINLSVISDSGYSSKGKDRGHGLYLVRSIVSQNNMFSNETKIEDGLFIQKLIVKK